MESGGEAGQGVQGVSGARGGAEGRGGGGGGGGKGKTSLAGAVRSFKEILKRLARKIATAG